MYEYAATVIAVTDGDTIHIDIDLGLGVWARGIAVRVIGIDAPEMKTDAGKAAKEFLTGLLKPGDEVVVKTVKDKKEKYGRYLATVTLSNGDSLADVMIKAGHARFYSGGKR